MEEPLTWEVKIVLAFQLSTTGAFDRALLLLDGAKELVGKYPSTLISRAHARIEETFADVYTAMGDCAASLASRKRALDITARSL